MLSFVSNRSRILICAIAFIPYNPIINARFNSRQYVFCVYNKKKLKALIRVNIEINVLKPNIVPVRTEYVLTK
jgi:hypothetical protein